MDTTQLQEMRSDILRMKHQMVRVRNDAKWTPDEQAYMDRVALSLSNAFYHASDLVTASRYNHPEES